MSPRASKEVKAGAEHRRSYARISYFMLFRLSMLAFFTVVAGLLFYARGDAYDPPYVSFVWVTLAVGYALTLTWAYWLPRTPDPSRIASLQTAADILVSAVVVQMTGGVDSGFATLYLIAVLGAATMGGPRHTWAAAGACTIIYLVMSTLQLGGIVAPYSHSEVPPLAPKDWWPSVSRTVAGLVGVSVLSSYLNAQLTRSVSQVGNLRAFNENIVRSLNSGLITLDLEERIIYFNPAARTILDLEDDFIGKPVDGVLPLLPTHLDGFEGREELQVITPSGRALRIGLSRTALFDADGHQLGSIVNFQDVTPLHELTQRARRNERLAALGGLAASVAHEIRNPLAAISGSAELLGSAPLADEDQRLLGIIQRESKRLDSLITDLLTYTRPRAPQTVAIDLRRTVAEACDAFRHDPAAAHLEIDVDAPYPVPVEVDPAHLTQAMWNLLRNAAQATMRRGRIWVELRPHQDRVELSISDTGAGIRPEHMDSIFDPFFTTKDAGTGFGLAFVHRIVEDNGGSISATSTLGRGTTFTLTFPLSIAPHAASDSGVLDLPERR